MAHPTPPPLHAHDRVAAGQYLVLDGLGNAELEPVVDVLLPVLLVEVGLLFREDKGVDAAVEVGVLGGFWG